MVIVPKFTPEILISAPRRAPAVPNRDGTLALFAQSTHTVGEDKTLKEVRVMKVESGDSQQLVADDKVHDAVWLPDGSTSPSAVIWLKKGDGGVTSIEMVADAAKPSASAVVKLGEIAAPVDNLKLKALKDGSVAFLVVGLADEEGALYNPEKHKKLSSIRIHDEYDVRIWDTYTKPQKHAIFYTTLAKSDEGAWKLSGPLRNALKGSHLDAPINIYEPDDPLAHFDTCEGGIVFAASPTRVKDYRHSRTSDIYYLPLESFNKDSTTGPRKIAVAGDDGGDAGPSYCFHPRISPRRQHDRLPALAVRAPAKGINLRAPARQRQRLDVRGRSRRSGRLRHRHGQAVEPDPSGLEFSTDGHFLYVDAEDCARHGLYRLDLQPNAEPRTLLRDGAVKAYYPLQAKDGDEGVEKVFVSSANIVEPSIYQIIEADPSAVAEPWTVSKASHLENLGLSRKQASEIYFEGGAGDYCVQAWVVKPRDFDPEKKYPLCLVVHGGPEAAWLDDWSNRWNFALWAEQGYIVVAPNITGSTGFGLEYTEGNEVNLDANINCPAVHDNWGGGPYDDLVNCLEFVKDMPGIDMDNAVAAGASYGGYMMNWIQGHELGRRFKAIVSHDGVYDVPTSCITSDYVDEDAEYGGPPVIWKNNDGLERYNPARPDLLPNWTTPMLVIHSDNDYRVPVTDGVAAFHTLRALGTPARFVSFPDENHWVLKPENSLQWHRVVFDWINRWSGVAERTAAVAAGTTTPTA
ncbi:oligopeptidase family protein [Apiospora hydei]|uniref:Dipeptidyl-peptidase V n=1 Tax=Apiospora hydei TaxID=1337664 RepID=A0ABR1W7U9_9PEZI